MKIDENWNIEYINKLKKHQDAIEYMELLYGIGIDEWETTMNPLHYLDALEYFYKLKQAPVMPSLPTDEDIMKWSKEFAEHEIIDQANFRVCAKFMRLCIKGNGA